MNKKLPFSYNVVIGINPKVRKHKMGEPYQQFYLISRVHQMDPPDDRNLAAFLKSYRRTGAYVMLPALYINDQIPPEPFWRLGIVKRALHVREAWELGPNDPDAVVLKPGIEPIIPEASQPAGNKSLRRMGK